MLEKSNKSYNIYKFFRAAVVEEKEEELRPSSADAGTEYSYGFLLWSFMHFGADNALVGVNRFSNKLIKLTIFYKILK